MTFVFYVIIALVAFVAARMMGRNLDDRINSFRKGAQGLTALFGILGITCCLTAIPSGKVGVEDFFGSVSPNSLRAGINLVNPLGPCG